jgi:hypothetical protein
MSGQLLLRGVVGPEVGNLQRHLNAFLGSDHAPLKVDEQFGALTLAALQKWQVRSGLSVTGRFDTADRYCAIRQGFIPFIACKNVTRVYPSERPINHIVIHTMENPEKPGAAENVALWMAGKNAPAASAHYFIDLDSVIQGVRDQDVAWHAPGVNSTGIGLEHSGFAKQTPEEWDDLPSRAILSLSAKLSAILAQRYDIPLVWLTPAELANKKRGFCTHADASQAFPGPGRTHWDPGPNFPKTGYMAMVQSHVNRGLCMLGG